MPTPPSDPQHTVDLLWGSVEPRTRGPKPSLSVHQIVEAAIAVADSDGLEAVSMHRVAKDLGVTPMSIYRYIPSKDDLVELLSDTAMGLPPEPAGDTWQERFLDHGRAQMGVYRARPWLIDVPLSGPPAGPNNLRWMDAGLKALADSGLDEEMKLYAILTLSIFVRGEMQLGRSIAMSEERTGVSEQERDAVYLRLMYKVADDGRFPAITRLVRAGVFDIPDDEDMTLSDQDFEIGLHIVLDGIAALATRPR